MIKQGRTIAVCSGLGALSAVLAWVGVHDVAVLREGSLLLDDFRTAYFAAPRPQRSDIIVLAVDEDTVSRFPFRSPIDRSFLADLVSELGRRNVRALGIDFLFDQATNPADDRRFLEALDAFPAPTVIAVGDASNGLTARQLDFQSRYLAGRRTALAGMLITDGVVRHIYPGEVGPDGFKPGFAVALAAVVGAREPAEVERLYLRTSVGGAPPIRTFPAHGLKLLPAQWFDGAIVLLGADLPNQDTFRTPLSVAGVDDMTGVLIHAQAVAQLLEGVRYPAVSTVAEAAILVVAVTIGSSCRFCGCAWCRRRSRRSACWPRIGSWDPSGRARRSAAPAAAADERPVLRDRSRGHVRSSAASCARSASFAIRFATTSRRPSSTRCWRTRASSRSAGRSGR